MTVVVVAPSVGWYWNRFKAWANEDSDAMLQALQDLMDAFMYLGTVALIFMFYGFLALTFMQATNITDVSTLPIFGSVINKIVETLGTGATVIVVGFLMIIFVPIILLATKLGKRTTSTVRD